MSARRFTIVVLSSLVLFAASAQAREPWEGRVPYGAPAMTRTELKQYWATMNAFETREEKLAFWREHTVAMQQRALDRGISIGDPPKDQSEGEALVRMDKSPYFQEIMTAEEVEDYYATLAGLAEPVDRRAFIADHIVRMRTRGFERGVSVPGTYDWNYVFESGEPPPDVIP